MADARLGGNRVGAWTRECLDDFSRQRKESIEDIWTLSYDMFLGRYSETNLAKWKELEGTDWRSKAFVRFARRKTISAVAQVNDIQLQGGTLPFNLKPSEIPEGYPGLVMPPEIAEERCGMMNKAITDLLNLAKYDRILMGSNLERAIYGMSVHKCPVVRTRKAQEYQLQLPPLAQMLSAVIPPQLALRFGRHIPIQRVVQLAIPEHVNLWDYFWDMEAVDHQSGRANIHRVMMDAGMVRRLADLPGYDTSAIDRLLSNVADATQGGSRNASEAPDKTKLNSRRRNVEVVELWGRIPRRELADHEGVLAEDKSDGREVEISVVVAYGGSESDGVEIRPAAINRLPLQTRPFNVAYWEAYPHETSGCGVPENVQDSQIAQNGAIRAFYDNKALSGNLIRFFKSSAFKPGQDMNLRTGANYELEDDVQDVRQAAMWAQIPDVGDSLISMLNVAERLGDEESGHPKLLQGERARNAPRTAFETGQLLEAANKQIGQTIRNADEGLIEPDVEAIYHYLMATDPREFIKGDYKCQATGFAAYNNKVVRGNSILQRLQFALSNEMTAALIDIPEHMREVYKSANLDPDQFLKSQDQLDQEAAMKMAAASGMLAPPGEDPTEPPQLAAGDEPGAPPPPGMERMFG